MRGARSGPPQRYNGRWVRLSGSIARLNRHTDKPHRHDRERTRNLRRAVAREGIRIVT